MTKNKPSPSRRHLYALLATLALSASAHAATVTWSAGATSSSWALGANWAGGVAPVAGDDVVISADGTNDPTDTSGYTGIALNSLTLNNSLGNNTVTLSAPIKVGAGGIINNTTDMVRLCLPAVNLTADQTWGGTRTIFVLGAVTGSGKLNFNGNMIRFDFNSPAWTGGVDVRTNVAMGGNVNFTAGKTITPFGTGPITLINQNSATNAATNPVLGLSATAANNSAASACTLANTIVLSSPSPNSGQFTLTQTAASAPNVGHFYLLSGDITGAVAASRTLSFTNSHDKAKAATTPATFILSGANTYAAATVIGGNTTLQIGNGGTTGSLGSSTGEIKNSGTLAFNRSDVVSVANVISGAGALQQLGTGTLTLTGVNTYTGATTLSAGTLAISANERIANTSDLVLGGGTLALGGCTETLGTLQLNGNAGLDLGNGGKVVFAESSGLTWSPEAILTVTGNFVSGRSLRFGTRSTGLSHAQLNQISIPGFMIEHLDTHGYVIATPSAAH
jgi:fibronectin-binding autotransporter adhesin